MLLLAIANIISYDTFRVEIYAKKASFHYRTCLGSGFVCQGDLVDLFLYPDVSPGPLHEIALGAKRASLLFTAIEMDIFSGLCEDISAHEFARRRGYDERNTEYLLNALVSLGLVSKKNSCFKNSPLSELYLVKGRELYMGEYLLFRDRFTSFDGLSDYVRRGPDAEVVSENRGSDIFDFARLAELSVAEQRAGRAKEVCETIVRLFPEKGPDRILDLGGGSGMIALALALHYPSCRCFLFESPEVAVVARKNIEAHTTEPQGNRPEILAGDYLSDDIGTEYDLIIAVASIQFAKGRFPVVIPRIRDALVPGGLFVSICGATTCDRTQPQPLVIGWLGSHLRGLEVLPEAGEIRNEVTMYGFEVVDPLEYGITIAMDVCRRKT